jgi:ribosomal protein S4
MRLKPKLKILKQIKQTTSLEKYPASLFKSNKKSWKAFLKKCYRLSKTKNFKKALYIHPSNSVSIKQWVYLNRMYKTGLNVKRIYYHFFDYGIRNSYLKRVHSTLTKKSKGSLLISYLYILLKPCYRLDILLSLVGLASSIYEAKKLINYSYIQLNGSASRIYTAYEAKLGDIIQIPYFSKQKTFTNLTKKYIKLKKLINLFCEIDYYTKTIVIINAFHEILQSHVNPQIFFKKFDIRVFLTYLKREY